VRSETGIRGALLAFLRDRTAATTEQAFFALPFSRRQIHDARMSLAEEGLIEIADAEWPPLYRAVPVDGRADEPAPPAPKAPIVLRPSPAGEFIVRVRPTGTLMQDAGRVQRFAIEGRKSSQSKYRHHGAGSKEFQRRARVAF